MSRLDIVQPRAGKDGKTYYTKIGAAWPLKDGGYRLVFEALPIASLNRDGGVETTALLFPPREDADRGGQRDRKPAPAHTDFDDEVPF